MRLRWVAEEDVSPARALATGAMLAARVSEGGPSVVLYGAELSGPPALALGAWQHAPQAVALQVADERGTKLLRRKTGGPAGMMGAGVMYVALCLRNASSLMECPPDRVLNRNVRGFLGGLTQEGVPAHYLGREWISVDKRPAGLLGWARREGGVLLEVLLGHTRSFVPPSELVGYPPRERAVFGGKEPITLKEAWEPGGHWDALQRGDLLVRALAEGHADRFEDVEPDHSSLSDREREAVGGFLPDTAVDVDRRAGAEWTWSKPVEIPIGFAAGGVQRGPDGELLEVALAGDFYQDDEAPAHLAKQLVGTEPTPASIQAAVTSTWDGTARVMEGVSDLEPIASALRGALGS